MQLSRQEYWNGLPFPSPGRSSRSRDWTCVFCISYIGRWILYHCATWEALLIHFLNYECLSHFPLHYSFSHLKNGMIIIMPQPTGLLCIKMLSYSPQLGFLEAEPGRGFLKTWFIRGMVSGKAQVEGRGCVEEHRRGQRKKVMKGCGLGCWFNLFPWGSLKYELYHLPTRGLTFCNPDQSGVIGCWVFWEVPDLPSKQLLFGQG